MADLTFAAPVTHVLNPLVYARRPHELYLDRAAPGGADVLLLGMNPGPWGMAQTGVPFGDVGMVRDWLGIEARVDVPEGEHPARPIRGFACPRSEVSGTRLWSWAKTSFGEADAFFRRFFVWNYCPLAFLEASGRNRTPDKLPAAEREPLFRACDRALVRVVDELSPTLVVGVGTFAEKRAKAALSGTCADSRIGRVLHPSPASPLANRGWAAAMTKGLAALGVDLPPQA